jgi:hypothetical protein
MDTTPGWSPDGTKIVYTRLLSSPGPGAAPPLTQIRVMNANGSDLVQLTAGDRPYLPRRMRIRERRWPPCRAWPLRAVRSIGAYSRAPVRLEYREEGP